jgi:galactonate dehydratase
MEQKKQHQVDPNNLWMGVSAPKLADKQIATEVVGIASLEVALVPPRWGVLRLEATNGVVGWGEFTLEGQSKEVIPMVRKFESFISKNKLSVSNPNGIIQALKAAHFYNVDGLFWSAAAGIEIACWDILGKMHEAPIHTLLGGHGDSIFEIEHL